MRVSAAPARASSASATSISRLTASGSVVGVSSATQSASSSSRSSELPTSVCGIFRSRAVRGGLCAPDRVGCPRTAAGLARLVRGERHSACGLISRHGLRRWASASDLVACCWKARKQGFTQRTPRTRENRGDEENWALTRPAVVQHRAKRMKSVSVAPHGSRCSPCEPLLAGQSSGETFKLSTRIFCLSVLCGLPSISTMA